MEKNGEKRSKQLWTRIEELYEETRSSIVVNRRAIGRFRMRKDVRQGCPLSAVLFNILYADLEEVMKRKQEGEIVIGKKKIWTIGYADDEALVASDMKGMKKMMVTYRKYLKKCGLELNVNKSKIMEFMKA